MEETTRNPWILAKDSLVNPAKNGEGVGLCTVSGEANGTIRYKMRPLLFIFLMGVMGGLCAVRSGASGSSLDKNVLPLSLQDRAAYSDAVPTMGETSITQLDCQDRWSCAGYNYDRLMKSVRGYYVDMNCACDDMCVLFKDCCPDFQTITSRPGGAAQAVNPGLPPSSSPDVSRGSGAGRSRTNTQTDSVGGAEGSPGKGDEPRLSMPSSSSTDKSADGVTSQAVVYSRHHIAPSVFSCLYEPSINDVSSVSMVTRCPDGWQDGHVEELCHNVTKDDLMRHLPVSGNSTRVMYRNMYCAICHQEAFVYWLPSMNCSSKQELPFHENSSFADMMASSNCALHFQPHDHRFRWRPCLEDDVISVCSATFPLDSDANRDIAARCEDGSVVSRIVYGFMRVYRNLYCAQCNLENVTDLLCNPPTGTSVIKTTRFDLPYSFSILLDINSHTGSSTVGHRYSQRTVHRNTTLVCDTGHVYDPFKDVCRQVACGPQRYFTNNKCVSLSELLVAAGASSGRLDCALTVLLNRTEYQLHENSTLELLGTGVLYNTSQFRLTDAGALVCVDYTQNYTRQVATNVTDVTFTFSVAEAVVSAVGLGVSLIAMAVTLCVYACLGPLRNVPGQNLLSLVAALFLADLLLLLAPSAGQIRVVCSAVAAIMHYLFLAAFVWMNVMALDVWFAFSKAFVNAGDRGKSSKRFLMYSAYAWLAPALFVVPAVVLQVLEPESPVSPGYGSGICWLSNKIALLVFFATPLCLLLLLNAVFFFNSARTIARAKRNSARMLGKEEEGKMAIYVKLTVVMGLTWSLGFLAALVPNQILTYSFVVMNTLQGLFIFLSFVLNKRVLGLLKDRFRRRSKVKASRSSRITEQTNLSKSGSSTSRKPSTTSHKLSQSLVV